MPINILLADDSGNVREGLKLLLDGEPSVKIVSVASGTHKIINYLEEKPVDIVIMDLNVPVMNGIENTVYIKKNFPTVKVMMISAFIQRNHCIDVVEAGVDAYFFKNVNRDELLFAINRVLTGGRYFATEFLVQLIKNRPQENSATKREIEPKSNISDREMEVLGLIAQGMTNAEMAKRLFISVRTIETRRKKLLEKTGTVNTATLIRHAVLSGLIS